MIRRPPRSTLFPSTTLSRSESIASQAAVALDNKNLLESIQTLFDGFVQASVTAIEQRDPSTAGHSGRVEALTTTLARTDRKSTRLNSSHSQISYAVFCLKKK